MTSKYLPLIKSEFGLTEPLSFEQIHNGPDNNVYIITDRQGQKYALRESKRLGKNVSFETEILATLSQSGFSVPAPIRTVSGNLFVTTEGVQLVLFKYILGTQIEKLETEHLNSRYIELGARKLGELHSLTNKMKVEAVPTRHIFTEFDRLLKTDHSVLDRFKDIKTVTEQVQIFYQEAKQRIDSQQELYGIIHNDYRIQNLIYTKDDCCLIDFDWACYGPLLKDLGLSVAEWSMFTKISGPSKEAIKIFLDNYNKTAPRKVTYDKNLLFWICFACLSDTCTFLVDVCAGAHAEKNITDVAQCHMYQKFKWFYRELV